MFMDRDANDVSNTSPLVALRRDLATTPRDTRLTVAFLAELAARHPRCRPVEIRNALIEHGFHTTSTVVQIASVVRFLESEIPYMSGTSPEMEDSETFLDRVEEIQRTRGMTLSRASLLAAVEFHNLTTEMMSREPGGLPPHPARAIIMQNFRTARVALAAITRAHVARQGERPATVRASAAQPAEMRSA